MHVPCLALHETEISVARAEYVLGKMEATQLCDGQSQFKFQI